MTATKKASILEQIALVENDIKRLRVLVECDMAENPNSDVQKYCLTKAKLQIENLLVEFNDIEIKRLT